MFFEAIKKSKINKISLSYFRNYKSQTFVPNSEITIISGANGIGKTNILESISMLVPGRGILNHKLDDMDMVGHTISWQINASVQDGEYTKHIRTGHVKNSANSRRFIEIDGDLVSKQLELKNILSISWLIPQMDQIFISSSSIRRKLLDRIVGNFSDTYSDHLIKYEYYMKERMLLLKHNNYDTDWMNVIEQKMSESAVVVATTRVEVIEMLQQTMDHLSYPFPKAILKIDGNLESSVHENPSIYIENNFSETLKKNRAIDFMTKRTNAGIHRSDLLVYSKEKGIKAHFCSTGEQKSLLISLFLSEICAQMQWKYKLPIILLDDISAHLDSRKQEILKDIILDLKAQTWVTGTDDRVLSFSRAEAEFITIMDNKVKIFE